MGYQKYVRQLWKQPKKNMPELMRARLIKWRKEPVTVRIERPTRIDRARSLGYKAKQGFIVVRQKVPRGGHRRPKDFAGRRPKRSGVRMSLSISYKSIAEQRAAKKFKNCEILSSYIVAKDGKNYWYEIILIDRTHPNIVKDNNLSNLAQKKGRVFRGLTSAGKKSRGLRTKGKGAEKLRPSRKANLKSRKKL